MTNSLSSILHFYIQFSSLYGEMRQNSIRNDGDELAKWVFRLCRIFGYWQFANNTNNNANQMKMTFWDCIRLFVIFGVYVFCMCVQLHLYYTTYYDVTTLLFNIPFWSMLIGILTMISSIPIGIWKRHILLKIISINREFDKSVSLIN